MLQRISIPRLVGLFYILGALFFLIRGFAVEDVVDEFGIYWMFTFSSLFLGILLSINEKSEKSALYISRVFVGVLFIVSGLIKANDTMGFAFKLEDYFREDALGWTFFRPYSLFLSVLVGVAEVLLGLAVLIGAMPKLSSWLLLLLTLFFGWLTFYTADCNDAQLMAMKSKESFERFCVTDCGCFGDALKGSIGRSLTPWESFYKDITLFFYVVVIFIFRRKYQLNDMKKDLGYFAPAILLTAFFSGGLFGWHFPVFFIAFTFLLYIIVKKVLEKSTRRELYIAISMGVVSLGFALFTLNSLPNKDFLPYAVGNDLKIQMSTAEQLGLESPEYAYEYTLTLPSGESMDILSTEYMAQKLWEDTKWKDAEIATGRQIKLKDGWEPTITDLHFETPYSMLEQGQLANPVVEEQVEMQYDPGYSETYFKIQHRTDAAVKTVSKANLAEYTADSIWLVLHEIDSVFTPPNNPLIDVTSAVFDQGYWIWMVSYDTDKAGQSRISNIGNLAADYRVLHIPITLSVPMGVEQMLELKNKYPGFTQFFYGDGTELKRVVRSNPGILLMKGSTVIEKWHYNAKPSVNEIQELIKQ